MGFVFIFWLWFFPVPVDCSCSSLNGVRPAPHYKRECVCVCVCVCVYECACVPGGVMVSAQTVGICARPTGPAVAKATSIDEMPTGSSARYCCPLLLPAAAAAWHPSPVRRRRPLIARQG
ncbi:uncharacterized protein LY79DRAFT_31564 [Colletotrichum navitas]|uniref:Secreted protein n=1 Tax=Colletotrichum navitas TaxID=681940 RepID=A0AAD8Q875_9PEZI|nr:uncharacterized protein LY79DRAFT_31564 [Colletotrichum navitas]KAK1596803.1 hypothetical protein LY79DRAFT_31564 [Colletotrichum navitas]